jgi:hypothetical protein
MARGPIVRHTDAWWQDMRSRMARLHDQRSRSAGSNIYPHLNSNPMGRAANPRPQGSASARLYPHLPQQSAARMQQPKPRPRTTRARRLYGDEY